MELDLNFLYVKQSEEPLLVPNNKYSRLRIQPVLKFFIHNTFFPLPLILFAYPFIIFAVLFIIFFCFRGFISYYYCPLSSQNYRALNIIFSLNTSLCFTFSSAFPPGIKSQGLFFAASLPPPLGEKHRECSID